ncbi:hypothetical protein DL771_008948 [Monosporascus sp. 5C6A]|nr:hypothetical protein DL771_008948 [Monosporascus sp. 5C6A]
MMTSNRPRDVGGSFASRRNHANQLSISDTSHHITETIGTLYGDDDDYPNNDSSRPLSFIASSGAGGEQISDYGRSQDPSSPEERRPRLTRTTSDMPQIQTQIHSPTSLNGNSMKRSPTVPSRMPSQRSNSFENGQPSPNSPASPTLREMREEASEFPLTNIEDPNDIAQELSNLQALRRMSMDVSNHSDPDLLPFQGMSLMAMPSIAPSGDDDESDPSRLLWVPAGVHPELAPSEFKNFLEKRVETMKRRSGESSLSVDGLNRSNSGSLRRKKSMLSRQVDNVGSHAERYVDGAERLERKKSENQREEGQSELTLDDLVKDPTKAVQKLTLESKRQDAGLESPSADDMPILPAVPGMGLRRSTRTTYRKGGSLKDRSGPLKKDQLPFSKRIAARNTGDETVSHVREPSVDAPAGSIRRQQTFTRDPVSSHPTGDIHRNDNSQELSQQGMTAGPAVSAQMPGAEPVAAPPVPQIIETPVVEEPGSQAPQQSRPFPERSSSQRGAGQPYTQPVSIPDEPPARSSKRPNYGQPLQGAAQPQAAGRASHNARSSSASGQTLNDIAQSPSPIPGSGSTRTDTLTFIPTFTSEEKKPEKKSKKDKGDSESGPSRTSSWFRFKSDDKEKKKKDDENRKPKTKALLEKAHDNVRLDVLQTSIDTAGQKGRESLVLDRDNYDGKLEEERKKESSRKSGEQKKDGLFASIFGGKKKGDRESGHHKKSHSQRAVSPEPPPYRPLRPDVDYSWTRFPILEERAIYRMAHIKLANPRRALYSQVLLSNFMYAYLAKVQAMHPQIQVPQSPQQKRLQEEERRRREQEEQQRQQEYLEQQQAQDSIDQYNFEYHRSAGEYGESGHQSGDYPEDAEIYDYGHSKDQGSYDYDSQGAKDYYSYGDNGNGHGRQREEDDDDNDMW